MTQEQADELNREQVMGVGKQLAFPLSTGSGYPSVGMTKREYMATQIMSGLLSGGYDVNGAVEKSIIGVDKLLIELNRK
jgi:hypothetical protein